MEREVAPSRLQLAVGSAAIGSQFCLTPEPILFQCLSLVSNINTHLNDYKKRARYQWEKQNTSNLQEKGIIGRTSPLEELEKHKTSERVYIHRKHCKSIMETEAEIFSFKRQKLSLKQMPYFWSLVKSLLFSFHFYI